MAASMLDAVVYARVSKRDGTQMIENQIPACIELAAARGLQILARYEDRESAMRRRPAFDRLMADAAKGKIKVVIIWSLDRLGRGFTCFDTFRTLTSYGVKVISAREPWTEAEGPARDLLAAIMSWVSGFERERLIERTRAGLERARAQGRRIGRPPARVDVGAAVAYREAGLGLRSIASKLHVGASTVGRALRAHDELLRASSPCAGMGVVVSPSQPLVITEAA